MPCIPFENDCHIRVAFIMRSAPRAAAKQNCPFSRVRRRHSRGEGTCCLERLCSGGG
jgi:hypothetical protein